MDDYLFFTIYITAADRKKLEEKKQAQKAKKDETSEPIEKDAVVPEPVTTEPKSLNKKAPIAPIRSEGIPKSMGSECRMSLGSSSLPQMHLSQQGSLLEEDEEAEETDAVFDDARPTVPWHHEQLYQLYGKEADYFLYPKMEDKERRRMKVVKPEAKKLRHVGQGGSSWWCHQMETFFALLAFCVGNSPVTGEFPSQRQVIRSFHVFFDLCLNKRAAGDLRCHLAHYDSTVILTLVMMELIEAETKWPPFSRQHFQMHFLEW